MLKTTLKLILLLVSVVLLAEYVIFPGLTTPNTFFNISVTGFAIAFLVVFVIIIMGIAEEFSGHLLDEDEMREVHRIRTEQGKPTQLPNGIIPNGTKEDVKPKRKYNRKPKQ